MSTRASHQPEQGHELDDLAPRLNAVLARRRSVDQDDGPRGHGGIAADHVEHAGVDIDLEEDGVAPPGYLDDVPPPPAPADVQCAGPDDLGFWRRARQLPIIYPIGMVVIIAALITMGVLFSRKNIWCKYIQPDSEACQSSNGTLAE